MFFACVDVKSVSKNARSSPLLLKARHRATLGKQVKKKFLYQKSRILPKDGIEDWDAHFEFEKVLEEDEIMIELFRPGKLFSRERFIGAFVFKVFDYIETENEGNEKIFKSIQLSTSKGKKCDIHLDVAVTLTAIIPPEIAPPGQMMKSIDGSAAFYDGDWKTVSGNWKEFSIDAVKFEGVGDPSPSFGSSQPRLLSLLENEIRCCNESGVHIGSHVSTNGDVTVHVAVWPNLVGTEWARVIGMDKTLPVIVRLVWPMSAGGYMNECPSPSRGTLAVRQSSVALSDDGALDVDQLSDWREFGVWWTIEQWLADEIRAHWQVYRIAAQELIEETKVELKALSGPVRDILDMFEWPISDSGVVGLALERCDNDMDAALQLLLDDDNEAELRAKVGAGESVVGAAGKLPEQKQSSSMYFAMAASLEKCMKSLDLKCLICGEPHPLSVSKPTICGKQLCSFQFTSLGLGINVEREILENPEVVDLLICFTLACTNTPDRFTPFPDVQARVGTETMTVTNAADVAEILIKMPPVAKMTASVNSGVLRQNLEQLHPLLYLLLRWIVSTNLAHIELLSDTSKPTRDEALQCEYQFIMRTAAPAREAEFRKLCDEAGGSFYTYHGSALGNWHSIVRAGLKNMSGTALQSAGAAFGPGIYMSDNSGTSIGYTHTGYTWKNSDYGANMKCMALCEVVDEPSAGNCGGSVHRPGCSHRRDSPHFRVEVDTYTITRYFFVFTQKLANISSKELGKKFESRSK